MTEREQLLADMEKAEEEYREWHQVWCFGTEEAYDKTYDKTKEEVVALVNYFEGKYDGLCQALGYTEE